MVKINLLPKNLRKRVEPGYWRLIAVAFPVLVLAVCGVLQISKNNEIARLQNDKLTLEQQKQALQRYVTGQRDLQAQQNSLNEVVKIDAQLSGDPEKWSAQIQRFLEQMPRKGGSPLVTLKTMSIAPINPGTLAGGELPYDGKYVTKQIQLTASADTDSDVIAFVQSFENSKDFGIRFGRMQRQEALGNDPNAAPGAATYDFDAAIGIVGTPPPPPPAVATPPAPQGGNP
jgi:type IV pilus assembly protein PilN